MRPEQNMVWISPFWYSHGKWLKGMLTGNTGRKLCLASGCGCVFCSEASCDPSSRRRSRFLFTILIALPLGILSAVKKNRWIDFVIRFFSFIGNSMPGFFAALVLMYFFSIRLQWLPVITTKNLGKSIVLPAMTLVLSMASKYTRQIRAAVLEELGKDYVTGAEPGESAAR